MADGLTPPRPLIEGAPLVDPDVAIRVRDAESRTLTCERLKGGRYRVTVSLTEGGVQAPLFRLDGFDNHDDGLNKAKMIVKAIIGTVETRKPESLSCSYPLRDRRSGPSLEDETFAHRTHPDLHDPTKGPRYPRGED